MIHTGTVMFLRRVGAVLLKEVLQLRRDRVSLATMITIPLMQLLLFGYAINTQPRHLPTAVLLQESSDVGRSILRALENTKYFTIVKEARDEEEFDRLLQSGTVLFGIEIPANFERDLRRGDRPAILVAADATDPVGSGAALAALSSVTTTALRWDRSIPEFTPPPFEVRAHARYNPAAVSQLNIVPGLLGTILTLTMLIFTALAVTRETERGTMETLLAMPISPVEIMLGKIAPYVVIGFLQGSLIVGAGTLLFAVPIFGDLALLAALTTLFIATNLSVGYTFSTLAQNQLQAMQMAMMYFLPNLLLSGFLFPFAGMPQWAQYVGETLPLTHYLRIVRSIMLKGSTLADLRYDTLSLVVLMLIAMIIAVTRFRRTLD
ncbi:ABC transporter permease [Rhodoplanes sp. SY1]|uniref:ABC transporter permease n=1 Tax=Rhodoplanes sp. SY1 TaxID=3166646 RepID=UPI0038B431D2